jgi:acyl-CoA thioesterase
MTIEEDFKTLGGLDFLKRMVTDWHGSAMADTLGLRLVEVSDGTATFEAHPTPNFYNPQMRVHGGYAATLLDSAMGCAVQTRMGPGVGFGTVDLSVKFVRKIVAESGRLLCVGKIVHGGRTMCTAEGHLRDEDGKLYAHGIGTFLVYPK